MLAPSGGRLRYGLILRKGVFGFRLSMLEHHTSIVAAAVSRAPRLGSSRLPGAAFPIDFKTFDTWLLEALASESKAFLVSGSFFRALAETPQENFLSVPAHVWQTLKLLIKWAAKTRRLALPKSRVHERLCAGGLQELQRPSQRPAAEAVWSLGLSIPFYGP